MTDDNQLAVIETVFEREQRLEKGISDALKMEAARHAAARAGQPSYTFIFYCYIFANPFADVP